MEIWGGNLAIEKKFDAPGLKIHVHSAPYRESQSGGGDIYYLTSCASGRITRFLLADISGHGEAVSRIAVSLRNLLRKNVNRISQGNFVNDMNREFGELGHDSGFATAVVATFFAPGNSDLSPGNLLDDDATVILGQFTSTKARLRDNLLAPIRLFGSVTDNTKLGDY